MIVTLLVIYHLKVIERSGVKGPQIHGYVMRSADQNFSAIIATEITKVCFLKNKFKTYSHKTYSHIIIYMNMHIGAGSKNFSTLSLGRMIQGY